MTHFDYITKHMLPGWVESWTLNFKIWSDLMTNNYEGYALLGDHDPEQECYKWFWKYINIDDILPKEFLEELYQRIETYWGIEDIDSSKVKPIPITLEDLYKQDNE